MENVKLGTPTPHKHTYSWLSFAALEGGATKGK